MNQHIPIRLMSLILCLMIIAAPAAADGLRFTLTAEVCPEAFSDEYQPLMAGIAALFDICRIDGTLITGGDSFLLNATLLAEDNANTCRTQLDVYGLNSHMGIRSSLLGDQELMINTAALLEFGQKTSEWLGIPLDKAALLVPYTHEYAMQRVAETIAPLCPIEPGTYRFTRSELDDMANTLLALCDEDAALSRWLEATGLYSSAVRTLERFLDLPLLIVPGLHVTRTESNLSWNVSFVNILSCSWDADSASLHFSIPTILNASADCSLSDGLLSGALYAEMNDVSRLNITCLLPASIHAECDELSLQIDASLPSLAPDRFQFTLNGSIHDRRLTLSLPTSDQAGDLVTLAAEFSPYLPDALPSYTPDDLTGINVLSVNSDSLRELMQAIRLPLISGMLNLLIVAPPQSVQVLMDALEDAGVIGLLTDAMTGGSAEY